MLFIFQYFWLIVFIKLTADICSKNIVFFLWHSVCPIIFVILRFTGFPQFVEVLRHHWSTFRKSNKTRRDEKGAKNARMCDGPTNVPYPWRSTLWYVHSVGTSKINKMQNCQNQSEHIHICTWSNQTNRKWLYFLKYTSKYLVIQNVFALKMKKPDFSFARHISSQRCNHLYYLEILKVDLRWLTFNVILHSRLYI